MNYASFYGGQPGISFVITQHFSSITAMETEFKKGEEYTEPGFVVYYNGDDVTKKANITYQISDQTAIFPVVNTIQKLESAINQLDAGKYKINYIADYIGLTATKTRTVIISDDLSTNENRS